MSKNIDRATSLDRSIIKRKHKELVSRFNYLKERAATLMMDSDTTGSLNFFRIVKLLKGIQSLPAIITQEGIAYEDNGRLSALLKNFSTNFDTDVKFRITNDMVTILYDKYHTDTHSRWEKFTIEISNEEVADEILKLKERKNPGPMGIPSAFIKKNYIAFTYILTDMFNMIMTNGELPSSWREAFLIPIFKKGDPSCACNNRGVAISSVITKIYDKLITKRLYNTVSETIALTQHGFNRERNILTNHIETTHYISNARLINHAVDIIYFDFSRAFDKLNHVILTKKIIALGIPL